MALPGLLAGACLAGTHGSAHAARTPAQQDASWTGEKGTASYYGPRQQGHRTASGALFEQSLLTAAHPWLPFGTKVRVTLANGRLRGGDHNRPAAVTTPSDRSVTRRRADAGDRQSGAGACLADAGLKHARFDKCRFYGVGDEEMAPSSRSATRSVEPLGALPPMRMSALVSIQPDRPNTRLPRDCSARRRARSPPIEWHCRLFARA